MTRPMSSRDPVTVAKAAKILVQTGDWRTLPGPDDKTRILTALKSRLPFALGQVPIDALVALAKVPPPGGCYWCSALVQRTPGPELARDEVTIALLGDGCQRCRIRWAAAEVAAREQAYTAGLVAAGFRPIAAGRLRTPEQVDAYTRRLRSLESAKLPPRTPTRWPPQPAATAIRRRLSDPPNYLRRPIRWPADAQRVR
jgi:hypothetical protein